MKKSLVLVCLLLVLSACTSTSAVVEQVPLTELPGVATELPTPEVSTAVPPTALPEVEVAATAVTETAVLPTESPPPTATPETVAAKLVNGRTTEGAYYLGSPDAPLTLIDYSDFL